MARLYLYSTNTLLVYIISQEFFNDTYYVYVAKEFDERDNLPSSSPIKFYREYEDIAQNLDIRDIRFQYVKRKMQQVADNKLKANEIDAKQHLKIKQILATLETQVHLLFIPLIYIIYRKAVETRGAVIIQPYVGGLGIHLGEEYIIADLHRDEFEVITLVPLKSPIPNPK